MLRRIFKRKQVQPFVPLDDKVSVTPATAIRTKTVAEKKQPSTIKRTIDSIAVTEQKTPAQIKVTGDEIDSAIEKYTARIPGNSISRVIEFYNSLRNKNAELNLEQLLHLSVILLVIVDREKTSPISMTRKAVAHLVAKLNPILEVMRRDPSFGSLAYAVANERGIVIDKNLLHRFKLIQQNTQIAAQITEALDVLTNAANYYVMSRFPRTLIYKFPASAVALSKLIIQIKNPDSVQAFCQALLQQQQINEAQAMAVAARYGAELTPSKTKASTVTARVSDKAPRPAIVNGKEAETESRPNSSIYLRL